MNSDNKQLLKKEAGEIGVSIILASFRALEYKLKCKKQINMEQFLVSVIATRVGLEFGKALNVSNKLENINENERCNKKKIENYYSQNFIDGVNHIRLS